MRQIITQQAELDTLTKVYLLLRSVKSDWIVSLKEALRGVKVDATVPATIYSVHPTLSHSVQKNITIIISSLNQENNKQ